jgi:hypothetical protein
VSNQRKNFLLFFWEPATWAPILKNLWISKTLRVLYTKKKWSHTLRLKDMAKISQANENTEEEAITFFGATWLILIQAAAPPLIIIKAEQRGLIVNTSTLRGRSFWNTEIQIILNQLNFLMSLVNQEWNGAPPNFAKSNKVIKAWVSMRK